VDIIRRSDYIVYIRAKLFLVGKFSKSNPESQKIYRASIKSIHESESVYKEQFEFGKHGHNKSILTDL
jgi:hypothetical protein